MNAAVTCGLLVGTGITAVIAASVPAAPDLATALQRLSTAADAPEQSTANRSALAWGRARAEVAGRLGLARQKADLALLGITPADLAGRMILAGLAGLALPALFSASLFVAGSPPPLMLPLLASLLTAAALFLLPRWQLRSQAAKARADMRLTICAYLELVALERAADAGPVEALERAAEIGHGSGFEHLRRALTKARVERRAPWQPLTEMAEQLEVTELRDVADIMRISGESGAAVLPSLRARAASLRGTVLQAEVAAANSASERMSIPVALLGMAFMVLIGYPALIRIATG